jgi:hemolysin D
MAGIWLICSAVAIGLIGAYVGTLDIHAVAQGRIHPSGRSKVVQPFEAGRVVAIKVENGSKVSAGDVLLELDSTETSADREVQASDLASANAEMVRRTVAVAIVKAKSYAPRPIEFPVGTDEPIRRREEQVLRAELEQLNAARASATAQISEQLATRNRLRTSIVAREKLIELAKERSDTRNELNKQGALSRAMVIDSLQQYETQMVALVGERGQLLEAEAAIDRLERKLEELSSQFITEQTQKIAEAERKIARFEQELIKAKSKSERTHLRAPINGTVQSLSVTSLGQVVAAGQALLTIVPRDGPIEIEALIQNQDIGFVNEGQNAVIKVEAFPFTRYGTINGVVTKVSRDAVDEREAAQIGDPTAGTRGSAGQGAAGGRGQNLVFPASISLERRAMWINGKEIPLSPGMVVSVEIKTGDRRLIDYVLSPLREIGSNAGRER